MPLSFLSTWAFGPFPDCCFFIYLKMYTFMTYWFSNLTDRPPTSISTFGGDAFSIILSQQRTWLEYWIVITFILFRTFSHPVIWCHHPLSFGECIRRRRAWGAWPFMVSTILPSLSLSCIHLGSDWFVGGRAHDLSLSNKCPNGEEKDSPLFLLNLEMYNVGLGWSTAQALIMLAILML